MSRNSGRPLLGPAFNQQQQPSQPSPQPAQPAANGPFAAMAQAAQAAQDVAQSLTALRQAALPLVASLAASQSGSGGGGGSLGIASRQMGQAGDAAAESSSGLLSLAAAATGLATGGLGAIATVAMKGMTAISALASAAESGAGYLANLAGGGLHSAFSSLGSKMLPFIEALNPAAAQLFQFTMRDLAAVVGTALMPVFTVLTQAVRESANTLYPLAQKLAPAFGEIAQAAMQVFVPVLNVVVAAVGATVPIFKFLGQAVQSVTPFLEAVSHILVAWYKTLGDFIGWLTGSVGLDGFKTAMAKLGQMALVAAAGLAKFFGATSYLKNLIDAVRDRGVVKKDTTGLGAATGGRITGLDEWRKSQLAAAFTASAEGDPSKKKDDEMLSLQGETVRLLEGINDGTMDARAILEKKLEEGKELLKNEIRAALGQIMEALGAKAYPAAGQAAAAAVNIGLNPAGYIFGKIMGK